MEEVLKFFSDDYAEISYNGNAELEFEKIRKPDEPWSSESEVFRHQHFTAQCRKCVQQLKGGGES